MLKQGEVLQCFRYSARSSCDRKSRQKVQMTHIERKVERLWQQAEYISRRPTSRDRKDGIRPRDNETSTHTHAPHTIASLQWTPTQHDGMSKEAVLAGPLSGST